jgi:hypothetical protein
MTKESPIVIKNREELIFVLSEASQLEHMIMGQYLFAAFTLKVDLSESLSPFQLEAVSRCLVQKMIALVLIHISQNGIV